MSAEDGEGAPPPRRRRFAWILPALLALGLLALFLRRGGDGSAILAALRDAAGRPGWLAVGVALFAVSLACGLLRWFALLRALRLPVPFFDALRLYATGHCFNVLGPGATGGDLVKAAWIALRCPGRRAEAVASIAAERVIGLLALVTVLAGATWFRPEFFESSDALLALRRFVRCLALGVAAATLLLAIAMLLTACGTASKNETSFDESNIGKSLIDGVVNITTIAASITGLISPQNVVGSALIGLLQR